jgi:hypothetical protein
MKVSNFHAFADYFEIHQRLRRSREFFKSPGVNFPALKKKPAPGA